MFHKFLKSHFPEYFRKIGVSVYIRQIPFLSLTNAVQMDLRPESDPAGVRSGLRNRFDDRNRLRHTIQYQHSQRFTFGLLFYPVHLLVSHMQHSFYAHRNLHSA